MTLNLKTTLPRVIILLFVLVIPTICAAQKAELMVQTGHTDAIDSLAYSPDGKTLVSGGSDSLVNVWDISTGAEMRSLKAYSYSDIQAIEFNPDGKIIITADMRGVIKLWDSFSGLDINQPR